MTNRSETSGHGVWRIAVLAVMLLALSAQRLQAAGLDVPISVKEVAGVGAAPLTIVAYDLYGNASQPSKAAK